jgi:hypothetical protein
LLTRVPNACLSENIDGLRGKENGILSCTGWSKNKFCVHIGSLPDNFLNQSFVIELSTPVTQAVMFVDVASSAPQGVRAQHSYWRSFEFLQLTCGLRNTESVQLFMGRMESKFTASR